MASVALGVQRRSRARRASWRSPATGRCASRWSRSRERPEVRGRLAPQRTRGELTVTIRAESPPHNEAAMRSCRSSCPSSPLGRRHRLRRVVRRVVRRPASDSARCSVRRASSSRSSASRRVRPVRRLVAQARQPRPRPAPPRARAPRCAPPAPAPSRSASSPSCGLPRRVPPAARVARPGHAVRPRRRRHRASGAAASSSPSTTRAPRAAPRPAAGSAVAAWSSSAPARASSTESALPARLRPVAHDRQSGSARLAYGEVRHHRLAQAPGARRWPDPSRGFLGRVGQRVDGVRLLAR